MSRTFARIESRFTRWALLAALAALAATRPARAQIVTALDPSARASGMGGASAAVTWGGPVNPWANPALATAVPGVTAQFVDLRLLPGIADVDARYQSSAISLSAAGLGIVSSGRPFGGSELEVTGLLPFGERVDGLAFGISTAGVADALLGLTGRRARISGWGDLAWGRTWKRWTTLDGALRDASRDEGWVARVTPIDRQRSSGGTDGGLRVDVSAAYSRSEAPIRDWTDHRTAFAVHCGWSGPDRDGVPVSPLADAFRGSFGSGFDLTVAFDHERFESALNYGLLGPIYQPYDVEHYGAEAVVLGVITGRMGYVFDQDHDIEKLAWGAGVRVPLGRSGDLRYDLASSPQAYPRRLWRHEITLRLDPIARWFGPRSSVNR